MTWQSSNFYSEHYVKMCQQNRMHWQGLNFSSAPHMHIKKCAKASFLYEMSDARAEKNKGMHLTSQWKKAHFLSKINVQSTCHELSAPFSTAASTVSLLHLFKLFSLNDGTKWPNAHNPGCFWASNTIQYVATGLYFTFRLAFFLSATRGIIFKLFAKPVNTERPWQAWSLRLTLTLLSNDSLTIPQRQQLTL